MSDKTDDSQQFETAEAAVFRAISQNPEGALSFRKGNWMAPKLQGSSLTIPQTSAVLSDSEMAAVRGMVDSASLQLRHHDSNIHNKYCPTDGQTQQQIFSMAEKARVESIGSNQMQGISKNIDDKITFDFLQNDYDNLQEGEQPPIDQVAYLLVREALTGKKPPHIAKKLMDNWGNVIKQKIAKQLPHLAKNIDNQEVFAQKTLDMIKNLHLSQEGEMQEHEDNQDEDESESQNENPQDKQEQQAPEQVASFDEPPQGERQSTTKTLDDSKVKPSDQGVEITHRPNITEFEQIEEPYKIYTKQFDQVIAVEDMHDDEELSDLRAQLDRKMAKIKNVNRRAANQFLRKLLSQHSKSWDFNLEDGILDGRKLPMIIADPNYLEYCKLEKESENNNTIVSLLIDNSGSMRGRPITVAAISAEILAQTLEACDIKVEILGFTTAEWKGGNARKKWTDDGSPKNPGRLNDLRHIIYKSASTPWRKARKNLGVMLKEGMLKENIDGEAIIWACRRLAMRPEKRKILMVISDGAPVDDSTVSANFASYLDSHLHQVIHSVEKKSNIELVAIGIGHDVTRYYSRAVTIREVDELESVMFQQLSEIFEQKAA